MNITIAAGKGGVGKSTTVASLGLMYAQQGKKTLLIDLDGGRALRRTLGLCGNYPINSISTTEIPLLDIAPVSTHPFVGITEFKKNGGSVQDYLSQFPDEYGLLAGSNMITEFFGFPTDLHTTSTFMSLVGLLNTAEDKFQEVLIDVEPTTGLDKLLKSMNAVQRSMSNLNNLGTAPLLALAVKWPDIRAYVQSGFIQNSVHHNARMDKTLKMLQSSHAYLVCKPEMDTVQQMLEEVKELVHTLGAGIRGYVVNGCIGNPSEDGAISYVQDHSQDIEIYRIGYDENIVQNEDVLRRRRALLERGKRLVA